MGDVKWGGYANELDTRFFSQPVICLSIGGKSVLDDSRCG
jgi:hypothetical protein